MKKIVLIFMMFAVFTGVSCVNAAGYPKRPESGREHYIIYKEGNRDDRIELCEFDTTVATVINWNSDMSLVSSGEYSNDIKYYLDGDEWIEFERGYERISNNASSVIESDIDVKDHTGKIRLYGQNDDGTLKSLPNVRKDWNNITTGIITYGPELRQSEYARSYGVHLYSGGDLPELSLLGTGHYIDIEGDIYPDKQKCYKAPNGYAIVPFFRKNGFIDDVNRGEYVERIEYYPDIYNKIYFTDENYNLQYIAEADFADYGNNKDYITSVYGVITVNDVCFAVMQHVTVQRYSEHDTYELESRYICEIDGDTIKIPPLNASYMPYGVTDDITVIQLSEDYHESEIAYIGGKRYDILSEAVERGRDFCVYTGKYYLKPNISSGAEVDAGDADNHRTGLEKTLYFSKDYINFAALPLKYPLESHGFSTTYLIELDDQYYVYTAIGLMAKEGEDVQAQIFSKDMIDELVNGLPQPAVYVAYKDKLLSFETAPRIVDGRTMISLRFLFETMGAEVEWNDSTKTATVIRDGNTVSVNIDSTEAKVNGKTVMLDVPPMLVDGRTLIPLRFISENLGYTVEWDDDTRLVTIY